MHVDVPIALVVIGTSVVLLAAVYLLRQLLVARRRGSFECTLQRRALTGRVTWQLGLMRYGTERLRWYRAFSLRIRPELVLRRGEILDIDRSPVAPAVEGMEPHLEVRVLMSDGSSHRLLVARSAASGLLAWLEAAPAGSLSGEGN